jgi:hypothetical protein
MVRSTLITLKYACAKPRQSGQIKAMMNSKYRIVRITGLKIQNAKLLIKSLIQKIYTHNLQTTTGTRGRWTTRRAGGKR